MPIYNPICQYCTHWRSGTDPDTCDAYPDGIPMGIWRGRGAHFEPRPGDNGIQFEIMPEVANRKSVLEWLEEERAVRKEVEELERLAADSD